MVTSTGQSRRWIFRYQVRPGERRDVTIGTTSSHSYEEAVATAAQWRAGKEAPAPAILRPPARRASDPINDDPIRAECRTFKVAWSALAEHLKEKEGLSDKTLIEWDRLIRTVFEPLGGKLVIDVTVDDLVTCLAPYWFTKATTAQKARLKAERVIDREFRRIRRLSKEPRYQYQGERFASFNPLNPASYVELKDDLPKQATPNGRVVSDKAKQAGYRGGHRSGKLSDVGKVILYATHHRSNGGNAFLFNVYTACRPAMVRFATWEMVNLEDKVIRFPASLMKEDLDFHLPLNAGAIAALVAQGVKKTGPCFPGQRGGVMSDATVNKWIKNAAKDVGVAAFTGHGSRTTFTNWRKRTRQHPDASEFLLAHAVQGIDKHYTEQRGPEDELWEPMVEVSDAWAYALDVAAAEAALA